MKLWTSDARVAVVDECKEEEEEEEEEEEGGGGYIGLETAVMAEPLLAPPRAKGRLVVIVRIRGKNTRIREYHWLYQRVV